MFSSTLSRSLPRPLPTTAVREARVVWVTSTTVAAERKRLASRLAKARGVFGSYAETTQPAVQRVVQDLRELAGQPDTATLIPVPHEFGSTRATQLLPRGARVVGWLDADGYRRVSDTPQPSTEWLQEQAQLR
jgi:integrase